MPAEAPASSVAKTLLGLTVADLTDAQKREMRVRGGVRVEAADGPAARANVREGDVILSVDNVGVADAKQFGTIVGKLDKNKQVTLLVRRGEWVNYVVIRPAK